MTAQQLLSLRLGKTGAHAGLTNLLFCSRNKRRDEDVTDAGAEGLAGMTALRTLSLAGHRALTSAGLGFLVACSAMTSLDLSGEQPQELGGGHLQCNSLPEAARQITVLCPHSVQ